MIMQGIALTGQGTSNAIDRWTQEYWYALYTKSRHEKILDERLRQKGIETFLPLRSVTRDWSDRKKIIQEPLFKGYLFVHTAFNRRWDILNTVGAVNFVGCHHSSPNVIPDKDIFNVRKFVEHEIPADPFPYLKEGAKVYVRSGPFKGVEGFIVRKDSHCRLVVSLDVLMQSISIQIDEACVELA